MSTRIRRRVRLFATTSLVTLFLTTGAFADRRVALIIGNANYQNAPRLANPTNDAFDVAAKLRSLGFDVIEQENADLTGYNNALQDFSRRIRDADAALFFYAGHGIQYQGHNYLMPVDAELKDDVSLDNMISLDRVKEALNRAQHGVKILILDACRNNPIADDWVRSQTADSRSVGETRGLAPLHIAGTVVAFSTQPNQVAQDGSGRNSPFSAALIDELSEPGLDINAMFQRVTEKVNETTRGKQTPEISFSLIRRYYLNTEDTDTVVWSRIRDSENPEDFKTFLKRYPTSFLVPDANYRISLLEKAISDRQAQIAADRRREEERLVAENQKRLDEEKEAAFKKAEAEKRQAEEAAKQAALVAQQEQEKKAAALKQAELEKHQAEEAAKQAALLAKQEQEKKEAAMKQAQLEKQQAEEARQKAILQAKQEAEQKAAAQKQAELERKQAEEAARQAALAAKAEAAKQALLEKQQAEEARQKAILQAKQEAEQKAAAQKQAELERKQAEEAAKQAALAAKEEAAKQAALAAKEEQEKKAAALKQAEAERLQAEEASKQAALAAKEEQEKKAAAVKQAELERQQAEEATKQAALQAKQEQEQREAAQKQAEAERKKAEEAAQIAAMTPPSSQAAAVVAANDASANQAGTSEADRKATLPTPVNVASMGDGFVSGAPKSAPTAASDPSLVKVASASPDDDKFAHVESDVGAPDSHALVAEAQNQLQRLGCFDGKATGLHDDTTDAALSRYYEKAGQSKNGMAVSASLIVELKARASGFCAAIAARPKHDNPPKPAVAHLPVHEKAPPVVKVEPPKKRIEHAARPVEEKPVVRQREQTFLQHPRPEPVIRRPAPQPSYGGGGGYGGGSGGGGGNISGVSGM